MALTDIQVRTAKARERPYKLSDGKGLYLLVNTDGARYWRFKYRLDGKEKLLALGVYPEVPLAKARADTLEARKLVAAGRDPVIDRKVARAQQASKNAQTFAAVATEWIARNRGRWSASYADKVQCNLAANLFPRIGTIPISELTAPMVLAAIKSMEERDAIELASRALRHASAIFRHGIVTGRITANPLEGIRASDALVTRTARSYPHLTRSDLGDFLRRLNEYPGRVETQLAVKLLLLTFVRTGELRAARWEEFDFDGHEWSIPATRMKMRRAHIVPLARQTRQLLGTLRQITGYSEYLFPGGRGRLPYMSENTVNKAIAMIGYKGRIVGHGFRATASTALNESGLFGADVIERQLAHKERNVIRAAYHRAEYLSERRRMMQWWADFLDAQVRGGEVVSISGHMRQPS